MTVLFAVDLSEPEAVTKAVQELAERLRATLLVIHVVQQAAPPSVPSFDPLSGLAGVAPYTAFDPVLQKGLNRAEESAYAAFLNRHFGIPVRAAYRIGDPAETIVADAEAFDVGLIVVAKHHQSRLERFLLGSVAEKVIRQTNRPVLVMPIPADT